MSIYYISLIFSYHSVELHLHFATFDIGEGHRALFLCFSLSYLKNNRVVSVGRNAPSEL